VTLGDEAVIAAQGEDRPSSNSVTLDRGSSWFRESVKVQANLIKGLVDSGKILLGKVI